MEEKKNIRAQMHQAMRSLEGLQKASPGPFFFTRVMARLQAEETGSWEKLTSFITRPRMALACLLIITFVNGAAFYYQSTRQTSLIADQNEASYADDYNANTGNLFYDENSEP